MPAPILQQIKESDLSRVCLFLGAGVDPDGLGSQLAMKTIVQQLNPDAIVDCFYRGVFDRSQNRTMREVLGLQVKSDTELTEVSEHAYTCVISVDGPAEVCALEPHFIIDHHKPGEPAKVASDVRDVGSASSIMVEYAREAGVDFTTEEGKKLAAALAIGILTDTNNFKTSKATKLDFESAAFCLEHKDHKAFLAVMTCPVPQYYHDAMVQAWSHKAKASTVYVAGLGSIPEKRSGVLSYLAELFCGTEGVSTAVIGALIGNEIVLSVRSSNSSIDIDEFVKTTFGRGGGKSGAGVARIPLPETLMDSANEADRSSVFQSMFSIVVNKVLEFTGDGAIDEPAERGDAS